MFYDVYCKDLFFRGPERDPWSIRGAAKAAWNIEFASVSSPAEIGPIVADSAHRAALRFAPELWLAFCQYTNEAQDHPPDRPRLWDAFTSRWSSESVQDQCERVRARLAAELAAMRDRLAVSVRAPTAAPSAVEGKQYRRRLFELLEARGMSTGQPTADEPRDVREAAARLANELAAWVEAITDAEADRHPAGGYWTVLGEDLREMLGPAELATGVFEDDWTPLLTQLRMNGLSELAESLDRLAKAVVPQAHKLARDMDAVAYLRNGGPRVAFYDLYAKDALDTHEACTFQGRQDVARSVMKIVGMLRTLAKSDGQGQGLPSTRTSEDRYEWARQVDLVRATNQVLGDGMLNKGVLSRACANGHVKTNRKTGQGARVCVRSFLTWVSRQNHIGADEANQIRNAVIGEISSRNS